MPISAMTKTGCRSPTLRLPTWTSRAMWILLNRGLLGLQSRQHHVAQLAQSTAAPGGLQHIIGRAPNRGIGIRHGHSPARDLETGQVVQVVADINDVRG